MKALIAFSDAASLWAARASAVILGLMSILILVEIFLWNTLEKTTLISDEYCAYGLAIIIFLGAGYCLREKGHIRLTLVLGLLPTRLARCITFGATFVSTLFMAYLWWYLFLMVRATVHYHSTSGTLTHTPLWIPQTMMLIGATCFLLQLAGTTLKTFYAIESGEEVV